ncbi:Hypothetical protein SMAX5B_010281 [Scophthalmus maximus]|uniref:Uncharacterized protein n=1 Tax=Scophthalmus maximus TaxID=52904 RepID=A0A2U9BUY9_SCOMX|nr:Hypothetical protein SMAX5B_010281 [Scophthalmus maximus]
MVPPCQKRFFSGPDVFEKAPREKMALCPEVPSPPRAEFLCDSGRVGVARCGGRKGKEGGEKTQKRHVWVLARCHASVRSPGGRVTVGVHGTSGCCYATSLQQLTVTLSFVSVGQLLAVVA